MNCVVCGTKDVAGIILSRCCCWYDEVCFPCVDKISFAEYLAEADKDAHQYYADWKEKSA